MINKKIIILAIFLVSLLSISVVSATENTTNDINNLETIEEVNSLSDNIVSESNGLDDITSNQDVLKTSELENEISSEDISNDSSTIISTNDNPMYPSASDYSVKVSNYTLSSENGGSIKMTISPDSSHGYTYYYYLKVYDSNNTEVISETYSNVDAKYSETYAIAKNQLTFGTYTIKIINYIDEEVMSTAKLIVKSSRYPYYTDYSVSVVNATVGYDSQNSKYRVEYSSNSIYYSASIKTTIFPASGYDYKYYYYLKVYDSNNMLKASKLVYGTKYDSPIYTNLDEYKLDCGNYTIKIINYIDGEVMNTARLSIVPFYPTASDYSVSISDSLIGYNNGDYMTSHDNNASIEISITPSHSSFFSHYYYFKVYDSNNNERISELMYGTFDYRISFYTLIDEYRLGRGNYTIKIINYIDGEVMNTARLSIVPFYPTASDYSVSVSNSVVNYGSTGSIKMNITPSSSSSYKYYYYLKIYDSKNNVKISESYYGVKDINSKIFTIKADQLSGGEYTIKIINYNDNQLMAAARLTIKSEYPTYSDYSLSVLNSTIKYENGGVINIKINPASGCKYTYFFDVHILDSNNKEARAVTRYIGTDPDQSKDYIIPANGLRPGNYTINLINREDNKVMCTSKLTVVSDYPSYYEYSVSVPNSNIEYLSNGFINMSINPASGPCKYYYYLKVYDSNNNELVSELYCGTNEDNYKSYTIDAKQLNLELGNYTVKIINYIDKYIMDSATLTVKNSTPIFPVSSDYSVNIHDYTMSYGSVGHIDMDIVPASGYILPYAYYLKVYDSNNNEMISELYRNNSINNSNTYIINKNQLGLGNYTIKVINYADNKVMSTAILTVKSGSPFASDYSVSVYDSTKSYGYTGYITMDITPATGFTYTYDYILKVYDSNNKEIISQSFSATYKRISERYSLAANQLNHGIYTVKILNRADNVVMSTATLTVKNATSDYPYSSDYSVSVQDTVVDYGSDGIAEVDIAPAFSFTYKYPYYLNIYDSNNNLKSSGSYGFSTGYTYSKSHNIYTKDYLPGNYTIKLVNYADNCVMSTAKLIVKPSATIPTYPVASEYSVNISDITMNEDSSKSIKMNINTTSNSIYKYYYYLKVYDLNNNEKISELYSGAGKPVSLTYTISANKLSVGTYTIKIINYEDNVVMSTATLTVKSKYPAASDYSVTVSDLTMEYSYSGNIKMNINPASSNYKYYYYLKVYDSNNNEKITELYSGTTKIYSKTYTISANKLSVGTYTIKIINYEDNMVMSTATLTVKSPYPSSSDYSVTVSSLTIDSGSNGEITMNINPASSTYKYYYYLKVYDSNNNEKISELYYGTSNVYSKTYTVSANKLSVGTYTIKIINYEDNMVMSTATLTVKSPYPSSSDYSVTVSSLTIDSGSNGEITMNINPASSTYKYYYYLKVYDSNNNEKISELYSGTTNINSKTYTISANQLSSGNYTIKIINWLDYKEMATSKLTVKSSELVKKASLISANAVTTVYNGGKYLVAILKDVDGKGISGVKLTVVLNGKTYAPITNSNGEVKLTTNGLVPKTYTATITFNGNNNYEKSSTAVKVTVKKATPKITAKAKTFKKSVKTKKYSITLKDNKGKAIKKVKVTIKINKKTYKAITNAKGVATFKITKLNKKGTFKSTITFKGNNYYNKVTKNVKIKIK